VIVEAMLCGKPVVAAAAGGAMELVEHGKTGWLVSPSDPVQLAAVIKDLQQHSEQREAIAHQGQIQASRFHINKTNQQVDRLLQQAVK
jgi:glycosyltransferase involved in cell wall biosynthesis